MSDEEQPQDDTSGKAKGKPAAKGRRAKGAKDKSGGTATGKAGAGTRRTGSGQAPAGDGTPAPEAEQPEAEPATAAAGATSTGSEGAGGAAAAEASERVFQPLDAASEGGAARDLAMVMDIPVNLSVELGRTRLTIKKLLELAQGSVIELDGLAGEPMDILVNGHLIAQGEVVVVEDRYGIRITEIITPSERIHKLNR